MEVLRVVVPAADAELAADALWRGSPSAVHEEVLDDGTVALTADVSAPVDLDEAWTSEFVDVTDDTYLDRWRAWATPVRVGSRTVVQPAWLPQTSPPAETDVVLLIDPGRSFGSGSHTSTRQVLATLENIDLEGASVLDIGCGSGVLSIAVARHGARGALALDIDQAAIDATVENAAHNGVAVRIEASLTPVASLRRSFDLVLANIGLRVLVDEASAITRCVAPHGLLILAGLLAEQVREVLSAYPAMEVVSETIDDGWACLVLRPVQRSI